MFIERIKKPFRRLQWKLTLSYTAVTVGSLFVVVLFLAINYFVLFFSCERVLFHVMSFQRGVSAMLEKVAKIALPVLTFPRHAHFQCTHSQTFLLSPPPVQAIRIVGLVF